MRKHPRKNIFVLFFHGKENHGYYMLQANKTTIRVSYFKHRDFTTLLFEGEKGE